MNVSQKTIFFLSGVVAMLSLSACNGIFEDIYDEPLAEEKMNMVLSWLMTRAIQAESI